MNSTKHEKRKPPLRVYLSHSTVDLVFARKLRNLLWQRLNARVFTTEEITAGEDWQSKLRAELSESDFVVALLTPRSVDSNWVLHELGAAWALRKLIVPVVTRRDVLNNIPVPLTDAQVLELKDLENPDIVDEFVRRFEEVVTTSHTLA